MKHSISILSLLFLLFPALQAQSLWSRAHLDEVRQELSQPYYSLAYASLLHEADSLLALTPLSVMQKCEAPASGDMHDYMSLARYAWPNTSSADGLPYVHRDGLSNPEIERYDRTRLGLTAQRIETLALAYHFSQEEQYAQKATQLIRCWFLDKATRMNPNLRYAQVVKGVNGNMGRCYGLIDAYSWVSMLDAVALLEGSRAFTKADQRKLRQWFGQLLDWMTSDPQGQEEARQTNNHAIAYDAELIAFARYAGRTEQARACLDAFAQKRLQPQIASDGSMPNELSRTLAFHYSCYNITHIIDVALMGRSMGIDIDPEGLLTRALDFLLPYLGQSVEAWPYQQLNGWEEVQQKLCQELYRTATYLTPERTDYLDAYRSHRKLDLNDRFALLHYQPTAADHAYAWAEGQLRVAVQEARKAKAEAKNRAEGRVSPRSIRPDGSLAMVGVYDWCVGFFPGELWQMYEYTHQDFWRQEALSFTWAIEDMKYHRGSHDLGFVCNNTFGRGYQDTGERSLRDVLVFTSRTLSTRFNPTVGCIRSWDHNADMWHYPVIVDNMMNLEMLFRATQLTGDSTFWQIAVSHADVTLCNHFREDASSFHVVDYEPMDGHVRLRQTHQGFSDDSFWSRGQGWGLYGYTMCYRFTHDERYLRHARRIAEFWLSLPNMPSDGVPYWDMKDPAIAHDTQATDCPDVPRDASAAALIASGLYELADYLPADALRYRAAADHILHSLDTHYRATTGGDYGFLLLHSTGHKPAGSEIDVPLSYADYYYLEALARRDHLKGSIR